MPVGSPGDCKAGVGPCSSANATESPPSSPVSLQHPLRTPQTQGFSSLPFLAHHFGRSLSWSPRTRSACRPVECLVFKEALSEASGSSLYFRETLLNLQWGRWD